MNCLQRGQWLMRSPITHLHTGKPAKPSRIWSAWRSAMTTLSLSVSLSTLLLISGCTGMVKAPPASSATLSTPTEMHAILAVSAAAIPGEQFNVFFPQSIEGFERIYTQEKPGFSEVKLKQNGVEIAKLAITDMVGTPEAAQKFTQSTFEIAGFPAILIGKKQTALLINDRFQVKVISVSENFSATDRQTWLEKFDLTGLANL